MQCLPQTPDAVPPVPPAFGARSFMILRGVRPDLLDAAAALYWQAFAGKLGRVLGPERRALRYLRASFCTDHALCAVTPEGELLGLAGFQTLERGFSGDGAMLRPVYGRLGGAVRAGLLTLLRRDPDAAWLLLEGLCVAEPARGQGVGAALVEAVMEEARVRHLHGVRLDVVDGNARARALYERLGFVAREVVGIGPLRHVFGFRSAVSMERRV